MILTKTRLKAVMELMEGSEPEGFAEAAMATFGSGSAWAEADRAKCPPDRRCDHCEAGLCNAGYPPLLDLLITLRDDMERRVPVENGAEIPF